MSRASKTKTTSFNGVEAPSIHRHPEQGLSDIAQGHQPGLKDETVVCMCLSSSGRKQERDALIFVSAIFPAR
jgi:hypothetical protein